jgi:hypothetical protein
MMINYHDNEAGLIQLFQKIEPIQGTFPPVYMLGDMIIGYNKLEKLTVLAVTVSENEAIRIEGEWVIRLLHWLGRSKKGGLAQQPKQFKMS